MKGTINSQMRSESTINLNRMVARIEERHENSGSVDRVEYALASIAYSLIRIGDLLEKE